MLKFTTASKSCWVLICLYALANPHLIRLGCCGEDETHRACLRHEDPQQVGDAEEGRGKRISVHGSSLFVTISGLQAATKGVEIYLAFKKSSCQQKYAFYMRSCMALSDESKYD